MFECLQTAKEAAGIVFLEEFDNSEERTVRGSTKSRFLKTGLHNT